MYIVIIGLPIIYIIKTYIIKDVNILLFKIYIIERSFNKMCLRYFVETFKNKTNSVPPTKYIPLQNIICEPETFILQRCFYHSRDIKVNKTNQITYIELQKDRFILGEQEHMMYEHISHIRRVSPFVVVLYVFARVNKNSGTLHFEDNPTGIIFTFKKSESVKFVKTLLKYITSYKKYNSFDKTAMSYKSFKFK